MDLKGRRIILGVTGSIAAYKSVFLLRELVKRGAEVQVLMTESAQAFVQPLSFSVLSKRHVHTHIMDESAWNNHVELGLWADLMLIAPCTAHTLAKIAHGLSSDIISAVYLSARCPVWVAPAMDLDMWHHVSTQENIKTLRSHGVRIVEPEHGFLASGLTGDGRLAEPESITQEIVNYFNDDLPLSGTHVLVNAGPTQEKIDPVRYISNHSSGKMGIALAHSAARQGAHVHLVLGPTDQSLDHPRVTVERVTSAQEMFDASTSAFKTADVAILTAAVADYRPVVTYDEKFKKKEGTWSIDLTKTRDIASALGKIKRDTQLLVGFALETQNIQENAFKKIKKKNLDFIVMNSPSPDTGFKHDTNKVSILYPDNKITHYELKAKSAVADDIIDAIIRLKT